MGANEESECIFGVTKRSKTMKTTYAKDKGQYNGARDFSRVFGTITSTSILLLNCCQYLFKDKDGEYVYDATSFDSSGNVSFTKRYVKSQS
jgi:hypothetical protein